MHLADWETYRGERHDIGQQIALWLPGFIARYGLDSVLVKRIVRQLFDARIAELRRLEWYLVQEWPDACAGSV